MKKRLFRNVGSVLIWTATFNVCALNLTGSLFDEVAKSSGLNPDLLYAVALAESAKSVNGTTVAPSCLAIRADKPYYPESAKEAKRILDEVLPARSSTDIGCMQINWKWHGHKVSTPYELLEPETNIQLAADILRKAVDSVPEDQILGIGRYHHWDISSAEGYNRAYQYGMRVLEIWSNIAALRK